MGSSEETPRTNSADLVPVAGEQDTTVTKHSHDGDQAQRPGHHQEPPEHAREVTSESAHAVTGRARERGRSCPEYQDWACKARDRDHVYTLAQADTKSAMLFMTLDMPDEGTR